MARHHSLDSERPIMAPSNRTSKRFSAVSGNPSIASSGTIGSLPSGDPRLAEFHHLRDGLERLENKPLQKQRFVPTPEKSDNLSKLALSAKVERALDRRMTGQDAVMRKPVLNEKAAVESTNS
ncbi:hypothetical protein BDV38DRAFT_253840 [Aspergillus pseudotamarii]|uniref:Uncharacterized protein n=1 Tax=Aspergillus pseudotamarii TaxID=132259 RepID=A0A5N6SLW6_ASPPS|nr:uncharacterized protein BDV38DRAFT_253840 [Aspergillus pseudotamarii]KAE8134879.1 hypothetical protein BDV38DRAFT_253840 [Aspergillus pseudotamarii]